MTTYDPPVEHVEAVADWLVADASEGDMTWDRMRGDPECVYAVEARRMLAAASTDAKVRTAFAAAVEQPPAGGHVLTVTHYHDDVQYAIRCHEPEGADCRIYCPESCETWHIRRDDTGPYHVTDGGVRHDLVSYWGGCIADEHWLNDPSPEFVWCRTPRVIGRVPVTPVWGDEGMEWHIPDPA